MSPDPDALLLAVAALVDRVALAKTLLSDPRDRLYHAVDGTWWKRENNLIISADAPEGWGRGLHSTGQSG